MRRLQALSALLCVFLLLCGPAAAQNAIRIDEPSTGHLGWLTRPYRAREVPPINLSNSSRLESLVRAGNLYLSAQDVVALAIENNIDVEIQRYGPLLAQEVLKRAKAGGLLRSVGVGVSPGPQSVSLQGVSFTSTGTTVTGGNGVSSSGGVLTQLGPAIPSFDPNLTFFANFAHTTTPQSNLQLTGTAELITSTRNYQAQYAQAWETGTSAQMTYSINHFKINSNFLALNPYSAGSLDFQATQNLLQGFGRAVNGRNIRVQKNNLKVTDLQFKQQVITTVAAALNLYWDLVSFNEDVRSRKQEVTTAEQLLNDNKRQVSIGAIAEIEITRAEAQLYTSQQDQVIAQTNLMQQETLLKNYLSRNGIAGANLAEVHIVPLDTIAIPPKEELRPLEDLVQEALTKRIEVATNRLNIESNKMNLVGIKNSLRPTLQAFVELTNNALTGELTPFGATLPGVAYLAGGLGNFLAQIGRRNFPNYSAGFSLNIPLRNRAAQSDYVTSVLGIRQSELGLQKSINNVRVDVQNAMIGLQQARARYDAAVKARVLQQQTFDADQRKFTLGASTAYQVVQDQRDLANSQSLEVQAMANYTHAQISFDGAMGTTLDVNHVSLEEALSGHVSRPSVLPATLPAPENK
jgi:outer membrane protein